MDKEMSRLDKWLKMLSEGNKWFPQGSKYHEKMVERVWKVTDLQFQYHIYINQMSREFLKDCEVCFGIFC